MGIHNNNRVEGSVTTEGENSNFSVSPIQNFYTESNILITGATGFIGKALVEKLLRSCLNISKIYLLIRPKKGSSVEIRHEKLLNNVIFDKIKEKNPDLLKKVVSIRGDVAEENLGLSESDRKTLVEEVDVVFHSAATVRFNEKFKDVIKLNTLSTVKMIQLCKEIKNLKAFIHVSTAFTNAEKPEILEKVYPSPCDLDELLTCLDETVDKEKEKSLVGSHPNNYTMTKAVAEYIISIQAKDLPVAIVRPSIVTGAWKEPVPGWVDNFTGASGIMLEIGRGTLRSILCDDRLVTDVVPVDVVVNTLITAAFQVASCRSTNVPVYNCTTGTLNPITWYDFGQKTKKHFLRVPTKYVQWYPGYSATTNRYRHIFIQCFFQFLPALFIDMIMVLRGMKPIMFDLAKKFYKACKNVEYFTLHEWKFQCDNMVALDKCISWKNDREDFFVDVTKLEWDDYMKNYVMGLRKFVLKDELESLKSAQLKLKRLYWLSKFFQFLALVILWNVFTWMTQAFS